MATKRRRSLLEDDDLFEIDKKPTPSSGDVCERCGCPREKHVEGASCLKCSRCDEFIE